MNARLSPGELQQTASADADLDALARAAFDLAADGLVIVDADRAGLRVVHANGRFATICGVAAGEMRGRDLCAWLDAGEYPRLRALAESAREHTEALQGAFRFIDRAISACWCRVNARRLPSSATRALVLLSCTEAKPAPNSAGIGTWEYDAASARCYLDAISAGLLGAEPAPIEADLDWFSQWVPAGDIARGRIALLNHIEEDAPWFDFECRVRMANGGHRWICARGRANREAPDGKVARVSGVLLDVDARKRTELSLINTERRLDMAMNGANAALYTVNIDSNQAFHSSNWFQMSGFDRDEWRSTSDPWQKQLHPDDADRVLKAVNDYLAGASASYEIEYRFLTKSGRWIWLFDRASIVERDAYGRPFMLAGTLVDISARKFAEDAQRESEFRYRSVADMTQGYVHEGRFDDEAPSGYEVVWASNGFANLFGCSAEEFNRRGGMRAFYPPNEVPGALERLARVKRGERVEGEVSLIGADGQIRWLHSINEPIRHSRTGEVIGMLGVGHDITTRKIADQALKQSESVLRSLTNNAPDWLMLLDLDFNFQWINRAFLGMEPRHLLGQDARNYLGAHDGAHARSALERAVEFGDNVTYEWYRDERGARRYYENRAAPVFDAGRIVGLSVRVSDITARQEAQQTLRTQALILDTMREGVVLFDSMQRIHFTNPAVAGMFGFSAAELSQLTISELGIRHFGDGPYGVANGTATELMCQRKDGSRFLAAAVFNVVELRDRQMLIGVLQDITDRKILEREIIEVANREQQRIGSDLHDGLGQELTGIALLLRSFSDQLTREYPKGCAAIDEVIGIVNQTISGARALARGLSPVTLEHGGLIAALRGLAAHARERYGLTVRYRGEARMPLPADAATAHAATANAATANHIYRIAQEALTNAARHSGASLAWLHLRAGAAGLRLTISDNGVGMADSAKAQQGMGLRIMAYRARMIGGTLSIENRRGGGLQVRLTCPQAPPAVLRTDSA